jgi:hypothetical protein
VVSLAVAEVVASHSDAQTPWATADTELFTAIRAGLSSITVDGARRVLLKAANKGQKDLETFRTEIESAFDDTMERASGWYKRKTQIVVALIAIVVTVALNVSTVKVATRLWNDEAVRTGVTTAATNAVAPASASQTNGSTSASGGGQSVAIAQAGSSAASTQTPAEKKAAAAAQQTANNAAGDCAPVSSAPGAPPKDPAKCAQQKADAAGAALSKVKQLGLPIGWDKANKPSKVDVGLISGWILTILALSLGAPFWFDVLNKFVRLRASGVPGSPDTSGSVGQSKPATTVAELAGQPAVTTPPIPRRRG